MLKQQTEPIAESVLWIIKYFVCARQPGLETPDSVKSLTFRSAFYNPVVT